MEIFVMIVMFMIISFGGVLGGIFWEKKYEEILPITQMVLIMIMFFAGLMDCLNLGVLLICTITLIGYLVVFLYVIKNKSFDKLAKNVFTESFFLFLILYLLIFMCRVGKEARYWDEFTCWAIRVKDMCRLDTMYTSKLAHVPVSAYPPATALIQYLYERIQYLIVGEKKFVEWYMFVAQQVFMVSFLIPLIGYIKRKKNIQDCVIIIFILTVPMIFFTYAYDTLMVDPLLGVMLGYCFTLLLNKKGNIFELIAFTLCQVCLFLVKDIAIFFVFFMWLYWIIDDVIESYYKNKSWVSKKIIWSLIGISVLLIIRLLWNQSIIEDQIISEGSNSLVSSYSEGISMGIFFKVIIGSVRDYRQAIFVNYCRSFFSTENFNLENFSLGISYFALCIFFVAIYIYFGKYYKSAYERKRRWYLILGQFFLVIGYVGIVLLTYMFVMDIGPASVLNCYDRYISVVILMVAYTVIAEWIRFYWNENANHSLILLLVLCMLIPGESLIQFLDRQNVYDSQGITSSYIHDVKKIEEIIGDDLFRICYMNFDEGESLFKYYKLNYGFESNQLVNMSGAEKQLVVENKRNEIMRQYDYILIYNSTDKFQRLIDAEIEKKGNEDFELYEVRDMKLVRIL